MPNPIFGGLILGSGQPDITQWDLLFMEAAVTATPKVLGSHRQGGFTERVLEAEFYIEMPLRSALISSSCAIWYTEVGNQGGCWGATNTSNQVMLQF